LLLDPTNAMVLAACSNARMLVEGDLPAATELARSSLRMNPSNPFAWDCLSISMLLSGDREQAHQHQLRANVIAARSAIRHFWDMGVCLTSVATGRLDDALRMAQSASALVPSFRPPLRYLTALHAAAGDHDRALVAARRLVQLEPDFTIDRLRNDRAYPVSALQRSGLLQSDGLRDFTSVKLTP
jgi:Flp pilus assembly protein TadD